MSNSSEVKDSDNTIARSKLTAILWLSTLFVPFILLYSVSEYTTSISFMSIFWVLSFTNGEFILFMAYIPEHPYPFIYLFQTLGFGWPVILSAIVTQVFLLNFVKRKIAKFGVIAVTALFILMLTPQLLLFLSYASVLIPLPISSAIQYWIVKKHFVEKREGEVSIEGEAHLEGIQVLRGCAAVGGTFEYKVKIENKSQFVINRVTVTLASFPDILQLEGEHTKKIPVLEPNGFVSPQFVFIPSRDCVEGQIMATVSFVDIQNKLHMREVEPYVIRSVCDLLEPLESSLDEFELLLSEMSVNSQKMILDKTPDTLFPDLVRILAEKNFQIISSSEEEFPNETRLTIRGLAEGKYTKNKVALRIIAKFNKEDKKMEVEIQALGEDADMLPTTIYEILKDLKEG